MRAVVSLAPLLLLVGACSSPASLPPVQSNAPVVDRVATDGYRSEVERGRDYSSVGVDVDAPADAAFRALVETYEELGIDLEILNLHERLVGNAQLRARRTFAGVRMSRLVDCGRNVTGNMADSHQLTLDVRSQVVPDGDGSRLLTWLRARAVSTGQAADMSLSCASTGGLESRIAAGVRSRTGGAD